MDRLIGINMIREEVQCRLRRGQRPSVLVENLDAVFTCERNDWDQPTHRIGRLAVGSCVGRVHAIDAYASAKLMAWSDLQVL